MQAGAVAIGEIGLDFKLESFDRELQLTNFQAQLDLAVAMDLPVMLHSPWCIRGDVDDFGANAPLSPGCGARLFAWAGIDGALSRVGPPRCIRRGDHAPRSQTGTPFRSLGSGGQNPAGDRCPSIGLHRVMPEGTWSPGIIDIAVSRCAGSRRVIRINRGWDDTKCTPTLWNLGAGAGLPAPSTCWAWTGLSVSEAVLWWSWAWAVSEAMRRSPWRAAASVGSDSSISIRSRNRA